MIVYNGWMKSQAIQYPSSYQSIVQRFIAACQADGRVTAALLVGSYAKGTADPHSDLDLYVMTADDADESFRASRDAFIQQLGEPLFVEDFDNRDVLFLIFPNGAEVELNIGRASEVNRVLRGPYEVLLDKQGILGSEVSPVPEVDTAAQTETLRRLVYWFWHDLSHFIAVMGRGYLWWGQGQLEVLRRCCVDLVRLRHDFGDRDAAHDSYWKLEKALPVEQLAVLEATCCPFEQEAMLAAERVIVAFFCGLAPALADAHGIRYPAELERVMIGRLERLTVPRSAIW